MIHVFTEAELDAAAGAALAAQVFAEQRADAARWEPALPDRCDHTFYWRSRHTHRTTVRFAGQLCDVDVVMKILPAPAAEYVGRAGDSGLLQWLTACRAGRADPASLPPGLDLLVLLHDHAAPGRAESFAPVPTTVTVAEEESPGVYALRRLGRQTPDTKHQADMVEVAAEAFARALREKAGVARLGHVEAEELGRRAAEVVGSGLEWYEHVGEVLDVYRAQAILQVGSRQAVYDLVKRHRLLGLRRSGGAMAIPLFQFDPTSGRPYRVVPSVLLAFADADVDPYTVASWFNTSQVELGGETPAEVMRDPAREDMVRTCAVRAAERWSE